MFHLPVESHKGPSGLQINLTSVDLPPHVKQEIEIMKRLKSDVAGRYERVKRTHPDEYEQLKAPHKARFSQAAEAEGALESLAHAVSLALPDHPNPHKLINELPVAEPLDPDALLSLLSREAAEMMRLERQKHAGIIERHSVASYVQKAADKYAEVIRREGFFIGM